MIQTIVEALSGILEQSSFDCEQGIEIVDIQIRHLANVRGMLVAILTQENKNKGEV